MHICQIITRLIIGGAQENTVLTCRGLVERGHKVTLVAGPETGPEGSLWDEASAAGCDLIPVKSLRRTVGPLSDWQAHRELHGLLKQLRPDVVHTHSSKAGIVGRTAAARAGVPVIVHTIHGMSFNRTQPLFVQTFYRGLERRVARHTTVFITVADAMIDQAIEARIAPRDRFVTIYSGMETQHFAPNKELRDRHRRDWAIATDEVVVGTIARLFENKGYEDIIEAMPTVVTRYPKLKFVWIGDGPRRAHYERRLRKLGLRDYVRFLGLVPPNEVAAHINGFDIVLHASRWEGLPRALVQGLLSEVPAISFDNDGAPEVVLPNETGILVPYGHAQGLADAIVKLASDAKLRQRFGQRGRARCLTMFDCRKMVDDIELLYQKLADRRV